jgi:TPR repeat protein
MVGKGYWATLVLTGMVGACTNVPKTIATKLDSTAPKYETEACQTARNNALNYSDNVGARVGLGAALGLTVGIFGLPIAAAADVAQARRQNSVIDELSKQCGDDALIPWFQEQAEKGNAQCQAWLGQAYASGMGTRQDYTQAAVWYRKAADQNNLAAQVNLGGLYANGYGVPRDYNEAAKLWRTAAQRGSPEAQTNLGGVYLQGNLGSKDYGEAVKWYRLAAKKEHASAEFALGSLYEDGLGVAQSNINAYTWYSLSARHGYDAATAKRDAAERRLTKDEMTRAKTLISRCAEHYTDCD